MKRGIACVLVAMCLAVPALAQEEEDLAKKLANPIASLISVPLQAKYDENFGPDEDGSVWKINIQPVIPFSLTEDWNLISRTILPVIDQDDVPVKERASPASVISCRVFSSRPRNRRQVV